MLNRAEAANYLGVSPLKFLRIAPGADYHQEGVAFWAKRILDILPVSDDFNQEGELASTETRSATCDWEKEIEGIGAGNWLCYQDGALVGRVCRLGGQWAANLEGELPYLELGRFPHRREAQRAVESAAVQ
jgi:hypothetical protein